jgi:hypothetical protein
VKIAGAALIWLVVAIVMIPSAALVVTMIFEALTECELNPWAGYTCPGWMVWFVFLSIPGVFTIIPALLILLTYVGFVVRNWVLARPN